MTHSSISDGWCVPVSYTVSSACGSGGRGRGRNRRGQHAAWREAAARRRGRRTSDIAMCSFEFFSSSSMASDCTRAVAFICVADIIGDAEGAACAMLHARRQRHGHSRSCRGSAHGCGTVHGKESVACWQVGPSAAFGALDFLVQRHFGADMPP